MLYSQRNNKQAHHARQRTQRGIALVFVLIMISIIFVIAAVSSRVVTMGERGARNDRDRQTAFQSAEAALSDAEIDIMGPNPTSPRPGQVGMFGTLPGNICSPGTSLTDITTRGFCSPLDIGAYKTIFVDPDTNYFDTPLFANLPSAPTRLYAYFGEFTGRYDQFPTATASNMGALPFKRPRYIIEKSLINFRNRADAAGKPFDAFIITAIGYGLSESTQVVLQAVISKPVPTN